MGPALRAFDEPQDKPKADQDSLQKGYQALLNEVQQAQQKDIQAYGKAKTEEEKEKIIKEYMDRPQAAAGKFLKLAQKDPKDMGAYNALVWVVQNGADPEVEKAVELIIHEHPKKVVAAAQQAARAQASAAGKLLKAALEQSESPRDKTQATFNLGQFYKGQSQEAHDKGKAGAEQMTKDAISYFQHVEKSQDAGNLGQQAKDQLFELEHLWYGKKAPEIEGEDIDGKKFKLSDYRGKVVLLDFWGNW
jgi:hypothetical protein